MNISRKAVALVALLAVASASGCAAPKVDFAGIERPARAAEMDAYKTFVGDWNWEAEVLNADEPGNRWTGEAHWKWILEERCLHGMMSAKSAHAAFEAAGVWSWHPQAKKYIWWMFNNWGYPQQGTATYCEKSKTWVMNYTSVGLDGTTSYGCYRMTVAGPDKLEWDMVEWADAMRLFKKLEMKGTYTRQ